MSKHTPGPWKIEGKRLITTMAIIISADDSLGPIAAVTEINAPLILAAPELLEALKIMTALVRLKYGNLDKGVWEKVQKVEALLTRIEGEK